MIATLTDISFYFGVGLGFSLTCLLGLYLSHADNVADLNLEADDTGELSPEDLAREPGSIVWVDCERR